MRCSVAVFAQQVDVATPPALVEAMVVTRHDAIEHGPAVLPGRVGVVVDDVHADPQASAVQCLHHAPELDDADRAVGRICRIAALGRGEMHRVVAPVEAIELAHCGHCLLLRLAVARARRRRCHAALLRHRTEVEHGQQVDVSDAGRGERLQMSHAVRAVQRESEVLAAVIRPYRRVTDRKVAHVQFVDHGVGGRLHTLR